jgi:hypothetical protein
VGTFKNDLHDSTINQGTRNRSRCQRSVQKRLESPNIAGQHVRTFLWHRHGAAVQFTVSCDVTPLRATRALVHILHSFYSLSTVCSQCNRPLIRTFLALPNGIPSHDTFGDVFAWTCPGEFQRGLLSWVQTIAPLLPGSAGRSAGLRASESWAVSGLARRRRVCVAEPAGGLGASPD